jgi:hypothetical protein
MEDSIMRRLFIVAFIFSQVAILSAAEAGMWSPAAHIQMLDTLDYGTFVSVDQDLGCGLNRGLILNTTSGYKGVLATLLTAFASGKRIKIELDSCLGGDYSPFRRVQVLK